VNHQKRKLGMNGLISLHKGKKCALSGVSAERGYQQPTVSSRTRALSPYTHRRMCQLSEDARQRLSHLQLGPHYFRKETESPTPFLIPVSESFPSASLCSRLRASQTSPPHWEQIHSRVQRILQTHKTNLDQRASFDL
uniref:Uncharacterized protein n=1 Tax=Maylandia zebra TaxID=106582 RepID=A0A3P9BRI9_9CICH